MDQLPCHHCIRGDDLSGLVAIPRRDQQHTNNMDQGRWFRVRLGCFDQLTNLRRYVAPQAYSHVPYKTEPVVEAISTSLADAEHNAHSDKGKRCSADMTDWRINYSAVCVHETSSQMLSEVRECFSCAVRLHTRQGAIPQVHKVGR